MREQPGAGGLVKAPQDFVAGVFLVALAIFAIWLGSDLNPGTLRAMGPGMVPRAVAALIGLCGVILIFNSLRQAGPAVEPVPWRGPIFISLGVVAFGLTIRGFKVPLPHGGEWPIPALGLVGAGPLAIFVAGLASPETRWSELAIFAAAMTAFSFLLFKVALNLPIPLAPFLFGY